MRGGEREIRTCENLELPAVLLLQLGSRVTHDFGLLRAVEADVALGVSVQGVDVRHWGDFAQRFLHRVTHKTV